MTFDAQEIYSRCMKFRGCKAPVALCLACATTAAMMMERGDGPPHVHSAEVDVAATFAATSNIVPAVTGSWYH
jgi:hypothetical protein